MTQLPEGWASTTLGTVVSLASGSTPRGVLDAAPGSIPFFKVADMNASARQFPAGLSTYATHPAIPKPRKSLLRRLLSWL